MEGNKLHLKIIKSDNKEGLIIKSGREEGKKGKIRLIYLQ